MTTILRQVAPNMYDCFNYTFEFKPVKKVLIYKDHVIVNPELFEIEPLIKLLEWQVNPQSGITDYERQLFKLILDDLQVRANRIRNSAESIIKNRENTMTKLGLRIEEHVAEIADLKQQLIDQKIQLESKIEDANSTASHVLFLSASGYGLGIAGLINPLIPIGAATALYYVKTTKNEHIQALLKLAKSLTIRFSGSKSDNLPAGDGAK